jgi:hypothetical protein
MEHKIAKGKVDKDNNIHIIISEDKKLIFFYQENHDVIGIKVKWGYNDEESNVWINILDFKKMIEEINKI